MSTQAAATAEAPVVTGRAPDYSHLPQELKNCPHWIVYQLSPDPDRPGKLKKLPRSAKTGKFKEWNQPESLATFAEATAFLKRHKNHCLGFAWGGSPFMALDFDNAIGDYGMVKPEAERLLKEIGNGSYREKSPSGKGIRSILRKSGPANGLSQHLEQQPLGDGASVELFVGGGCTITGDWLVGEGIPEADPHEVWQICQRSSRRNGNSAPAKQLTNTLDDGTRDVGLTRLGGKLRRQGCSRAVIEAALLVANQEQCLPPLDASQVRKIANSVARYEAGKEVDPSEWRSLFRSYAEEEDIPFEWLVEGFIEKESITAIAGLSANGKTLISLSLAKALVYGTKFLGCFQVLQSCSVLYLIPEAGSRGFRKRLRSFHLDQAGERFLYRTLSHGVTPSLSDPRILEAARDRVVFLDTGIRFSAGDENSASENQRYLAADIFNLLQAGALAVIVIHHSPKFARKDDVMNLENVMRGTTDLGAMMSNVYGVRQLDSATNLIHVECVKARDIEPCQPFEIEGRPWIDQEGDFRLVKVPGSCGSLRESNDVSIRQRVAGLKAEGKTERQIASLLGLPKTTVHRMLVDSSEVPQQTLPLQQEVTSEF